MKKGLFITIEGMDGSGKTTQINMIRDYISEKGYNVMLAREPGGTKISEKIRDIILDPANGAMAAITEVLLYASARAQLVAEVIKPAVESGSVVVCDRFIDSSFAYQGFGRGIDIKTIADVNRAAIDGMMPDLTFFIDMSPEIALKRRMASSEADRIEKEHMEFHMKAYNGYKELARLYPERIKTIDGNRTVEEISQEIRKWLDTVV
ncbi:MAG TPA: dTMP kinase [Clostridiaceae bacterium]|nr:dTMP kinase [Clostridiaceae bacterium]